MRHLPNILTIFRVLASLLVPLLLFFGGDSWRLTAMVIFTAASISDWLDGMIARQLNAISTLGRMLDPIADKLLIAGCLIALIALDMELGVLCRPDDPFARSFVSGLREFMADLSCTSP